MESLIRSFAGSHILIAEDERHSRLSLYLTLKKEGHLVVTAEDGIEAFNKITYFETNKKPFQLLITDYMLPKINGLELIDKLRDKGIKLPTIMMTGYGNNELVNELKKRGDIDYLDKPFAPKILLKRIALKLDKAKKKTKRQGVESIRV